MRLIVLGSNSAGNGYILTNGEETLIIEAGMSVDKLKKAIDFNVSSIQGIIISHRHGDHAKHLRKYFSLGAPVFAGGDVLDEFGDQNTVTIQRPLSKVEFGRFKIVAFEVFHDVPTFGFHISHPDTGNILFLTDTYMCEYTFDNLSHILIEANYARDILEKNVLDGKISKYLQQRVWMSHMELETTKGVLKANSLDQVRNIVLIHLSDYNSNEERFVTEVEQLTGLPVYAANPKLELDFAL